MWTPTRHRAACSWKLDSPAAPRAKRERGGRSTGSLRARAGWTAAVLAIAVLLTPVAWAQAPASALRLDVNIPAYRLDAWRDTTLVATWGVSVGMRKWKTPIGTYAASAVEWNPWWIPPDSPWARDEKVTPPGPDNPMGRVKIFLGQLIFAHGTPFPESVGRAASHGCLRMRNDDVEALAWLVLLAGGVDSTEVAQMAVDTVTRRVAVLPAVPTLVRYDLIEWRADTLWRYPDIYRKGGATLRRALVQLAAGGVDTMAVDRRALRAWLSRRITRPSPYVPKVVAPR
jgi:murein L,D-transpeptidase YcbB/YkuD